MRRAFFNKLLVFLLIIFVLIDIVLVLLVVNPQALSLLTKFSPAPKPGRCLILEEKYCKKAKLINDPGNPNGLLAAYRVDKGAVLFAPVEGFYSHTPTFFFTKDKTTKEVVKYPGATISISKDNSARTTSAIYSFIYFKEKEGSYSRIRKREIIGAVSNKPIDFLGDYNLIVGVSKQRLAQGKIVFENDSDQLKRILNLK